MKLGHRATCSWLVIAILLALQAVVWVASADAQPLDTPKLPSSGKVGEIHRDSNGRLIVTSPPPAAGRSDAVEQPPVRSPGPKVGGSEGSSSRPSVPADDLVLAQTACPEDSIGCFAVNSTASTDQTQVAVTVGQAFLRGALPADAMLAARDNTGQDIKVQIDQTALHGDRSVRFGIVTAILPKLAAHGHALVALYRSATKRSPVAAGIAAADLIGSGFDAKIDLNIYSPQISVIQFGNRDGHTPGIPFETGEKITLEIGDDPVERHSLTVTPESAGGAFDTLTKLVLAFASVINKESQQYRAYKAPNSFEELSITSKKGLGKPFPIVIRYAGRAKSKVSVIQTWTAARRYAASAAQLLQRGRDGAVSKMWLSGPIASEFILRGPFSAVDDNTPHPHLTAGFHVRAYRDTPAVRTDFIIENDWAYEPGPRNWTYDVVMSAGGKTIYEKLGLVHYQHARWHKVGWSGAEPKVAVAQALQPFTGSKIVPNYKLDFPIFRRDLAKTSEALAHSDVEPMGNGLVSTYMPMTGGRRDIGFLPTWSVFHLLGMDPQARRVDLANGDVAGSVPLHYRDKATELPVSLDDHPGMTMEFGRPDAKDAFPPVANGETIWAVDSAHQPALVYMPYLATGDLFYLEELMYWANWNMASVDPNYRQREKGLITGQVRGVAWALRSLGQVVAVLPSQHRMRPYFTEKLTNNLDYLLSEYVHNPGRRQGELDGLLEAGREPGSVGPWQSDFLAIVLGFLADVELPAAETTLQWLAQFTVGRWTHQAEGYCFALAPAYYLKIRAADGRPLRTWAELFHENYPDVTSCPVAFAGGLAESPYDYVAVASASLATAAAHQIAGAATAYAALHRMAPNLRSKFAGDPTWAIAPR
jgi:hypothetical protein